MVTMQTLKVELNERSYPIYVGDNLLSQPDLLQQHIPGQEVFIVSNTTVAPLYLKQLKQLLPDFRTESLELPDGEKYKTAESLAVIYDKLLQQRCSRTTTLIALGGGVIGDITGFAAATYQRGIHFVQIPTTLLAQVDSSVGGKTAINHPLGKNMIGAFYQPRCVIADLSTLKTLPERELAAGMAEVIKYGLIADADFFDWIEKNIHGLMQLQPELIDTAVVRSCANKAKIVAADERENNQRALLNLGHTFGHAIETFVSYKGWLHGEAVATGISIAAKFSKMLGWLNQQDVDRIDSLLSAAKLPLDPPGDMQTDDFMQLMAHDKKVIDSTIRFVLLRSIGNATVNSDYDAAVLKQCLDETTNH